MASLPEATAKAWDRLPSRMQSVLAHLLSAGMGVLVALMLFYVLYRISLPSKPFIYVAF